MTRQTRVTCPKCGGAAIELRRYLLENRTLTDNTRTAIETECGSSSCPKVVRRVLEGDHRFS